MGKFRGSKDRDEDEAPKRGKGKDKGGNAAKGKRRGSGIGAAAAESEEFADRLPYFPKPGTYRVVWTNAEQPPKKPGRNPWLVLSFKGAGKSEKIGERGLPLCIGSTSLDSTGRRVKTLARAITGLSKDDYAQFDPEGAFIDALCENDRDAMIDLLVEGEVAKNKKKAAAMLDAEISVKVVRGNDTDDGDWFRECTFAAVSEDEDDEDEEDEDEEDDEPPAKGKGKGKGSKRRASDEDEDDEDEDDEDEDEDDDEDEEDDEPPAKSKGKKKAGRK